MHKIVFLKVYLYINIFVLETNFEQMHKIKLFW